MDQTTPFDQMPPLRPKNWLVESILVTIFCCLPFGIVGIINAASVNSKYDSGDYAGALYSSQQAGKWTKIGFFTGIAVTVIYLIFVFTVGISSFMPHH
ncbi:Interferon-induced transmembrane protein [Mucilaginibacter mallensis]|uniref:Interferon-induced transmembrane protein n=2 Tax=Mucilaginibacter TaxID=423349 RepID=A0A1H1NTZ2_MUCMA|nr:CD225/dispanin family protein [Mucilaginibacter mallensis]SDS02424.1 Interferon-induced transmembrane protein [Mucilaginibacter mallensis]